MGFAKVKVQILPDQVFPQEINMIMSRPLIDDLGIKNTPFWITFGSQSETAHLAAVPGKSKIIRIHSKLASQLKITNIPSIYAKFDPQTRRLRLGPILGIMINPTPLHDQPDFGVMGKFLEECSYAGMQKGAQVIIFPPEQVSLEKRTIRGWGLSKGKWRVITSPLPDAVYNRILSRKLERIPSVQQTLHQLSKVNNIPVFNEKFLNKQEVFDVLQVDDSIRNMLPETVVYKNNSLREMAQKYVTLYLKPTNGSLGSGIIRIKRLSSGWVVQSTTASGTSSRKFSKFSELVRVLSHKIKKQSYLIQEGIDLVKLQNRPVDFRVLVQKNRQGEWSITSSVGRIANSQQIVSNVARGGTIRKAHEVLAELAIKKKPTIQQIRNTALQIAKTFEQKAEGHFAELGIDLALDRKGKIWLIEINSKPSKTDDSLITNSPMITRPSVTKLIDYTLFLSGVSQTRFPKMNGTKRRLRR